MVAAGHWRDYAIDLGVKSASFSAFRRTAENPEIRIVKDPALRQKQAETLAANASLDTLEENESKPVETPIDSGVLALLVAGGLLAGWYLRHSRLTVG